LKPNAFPEPGRLGIRWSAAASPEFLKIPEANGCYSWLTSPQTPGPRPSPTMKGKQGFANYFWTCTGKTFFPTRRH